MTQQALADRVQISREHLSRIENGHKAVTDRRLLGALATALEVSVDDLIDQPTVPRSQHDLAVYPAVPALRGALDDDPPDDRAIDAQQLTADVLRVSAARAACDYPTLARMLPRLIADTRRLANGGGECVRLGLELFVRVSVTAAIALKPVGYLDLAARLCERARLAADMLDQPVERAAAAYAAAQCALASGTAGGRQRSLRLAADAADRLGDTGDDDALGWYVMLHLHAGLSAATADHSDTAIAHHREAARAATRIRTDPWHMEPLASNVGIWRVAIALENGEPARAQAFARQVDRSSVRTRQRLSHLHIHAGRGAVAVGDTTAAVRHFLEADTVSLSELRTRPLVKKLVGRMMRDARRRGSPELRDLATRVGIDPLDPDIGQRAAGQDVTRRSRPKPGANRRA
jgi:transcriptional regulator with XRE-family HTH domain